MHINTDRLKKSLDTVNAINQTAEGGVTRLALSDEDKAGRELLKKWAEEADLVLRVDDLGNMYARRVGVEPHELPVCMGSHMDTQPNSGQYDGLLGVLAGLEVLRTLKDNNVITRYPIELINWTNEEGVRFVPALTGSGVIVGTFDTQWAYNLIDKDGKMFADELARIGYLGEKSNRLSKARAFLEVHVEQGPILETEGYPVGVVTDILGMTWLEITIYGQADHAGPSPMSTRHDPMFAAAAVIGEIREKIKAYGDPVVTTVGRISALPGSINIIPGEVTFTLDFRHFVADGLKEIQDEVMKILKKVCMQEGTSFNVKELWTIPPTHFNEKIVNTIEEAANALKIPNRRIISGAGHDAKYISEMVPTGMIFVRSLGGKSHCPQELSSTEDIGKATQVLLDTILKLAN